jgi:glycosyltransferase involved in cell wall biosynthesis
VGQARRRKASGGSKYTDRHLTVAVCIPTIPGREVDLMRAQTSVMQQTRQPDHVLVYTDTERRGAAYARNQLLDQAEDAGVDVIAWLDDDDYFKANHIKACMRAMENTFAVDLVYPIPIFVGHQDPTAVTHQGVFPTSPWGLRFTQEHAAHIREVGSFIPMTHLVRTETVRRVGGFPDGRFNADGRYQGEDELYLIKMLETGAEFLHLAERTWYWPKNPKSTAGKGVMQHAS